MTSAHYRDRLYSKESRILDADDSDLANIESDLDKLSQELNARSPMGKDQDHFSTNNLESEHGSP